MLSDNIRNCRKEKNMSQDELAERLGVSRQSISLWETGQTQPTIDNLIALSKIFNVSSDALLTDTDSDADSPKAAPESAPGSKKRPPVWLIAAVIVLVLGAAALTVWLAGNGRPAAGTDAPPHGTSEPGDADSLKTTGRTTAAAAKSTKAPATKNAAGGRTTSGKKPQTAAAVQTTKQTAARDFDLFAYCKAFAIEKGELNGDYCMYQQPAARYGGYTNEYFSLAYWGDSDMVEFCLHCPLDETFSVNFYLRMRGGYNGRYEYAASRYYRDSGNSLRFATGHIDPAVFSDRYPLSCDQYEGSPDGQDAFMEESRVGICDLIRCLKNFVGEENMDCDFSAFGFVRF